MVEEEGVIDEIKAFVSKYPDVIQNSNDYSITKTIGLTEAIDFLNKKITIDEFIANSVKTTRNYAKRQCTWFNNQFEKFDLSINDVPNDKTYIPILNN